MTEDLHISIIKGQTTHINVRLKNINDIGLLKNILSVVDEKIEPIKVKRKYTKRVKKDKSIFNKFKKEKNPKMKINQIYFYAKNLNTSFTLDDLQKEFPNMDRNSLSMNCSKLKNRGDLRKLKCGTFIIKKY